MQTGHEKAGDLEEADDRVADERQIEIAGAWPALNGALSRRCEPVTALPAGSPAFPQEPPANRAAERVEALFAAAKREAHNVGPLVSLCQSALDCWSILSVTC